MNRNLILSFILVWVSMVTQAQIEYTTLFQSIDTPQKIYYRIPALATCKDGSIIAICDERLNEDKDVHSKVNIRLVGRKSYDNGVTWSDAFYIAGDKEEHVMAGDENSLYKAYSDPAIVVDRTTGKIIVFCVHGCNIQEARAGTIRPNLVRIESDDNGLTWKKPENITSYFFGENYQGGNTIDGRDPKANWCYEFFPSGRVLQLRDGRLAVAMFVSDSKANISIFPPSITYKTYNYLYISEDLGKSWQLKGNCAMEMGDEAKLEELADGRIMISSRLSNKAGRGYNYYNPKTERWGTATYSNDPITAQCNGEIKVLTSIAEGHSRNRMLFSIPNSSSRQNISLFYSYDEGDSWTLGKSILPDLGDYSTLAVLPDNSIGIFFEESFVSEKGTRFFKLNFARLTLEELTDNTDYLNIHVSEDSNPLNDIPFKGIDGNLEIEASVKNIITDYPNDLTVAGKTLIHKTIEGNSWHAISFPFDIDKVLLNFSDANRVEVSSMLAASKEDIASHSYFNLQEYKDGKFQECASIKANTPYLFRLPASIYRLDLIFLAKEKAYISSKDTIDSSSSNSGIRFCAAPNNLNNKNNIDALILNEEGTAFVKQSLATIYPFDAYMVSNKYDSFPTPSVTNDLENVEVKDYSLWTEGGILHISPKKRTHIMIFDLKGTLVWSGHIANPTRIVLAKGVYIINREQKIIL